MGRIKTKPIKRATNKLFKEHGEEIKEDFEENKKLVTRYAHIPSKRLRNAIAGYVTRLKKKTEVM